jgi:hypothetical protein
VLRRPTLEDEASIGEARRKSYQKDMKNSDILSKVELEKFAAAREMWSSDIPDRIRALTQKTGEAMQVLEVTGFKSVDDLSTELTRIGKELKDLFPEETDLGKQLRDAIDRFVGDAEYDYDDKALIQKHATGSQVYDLVDEADVVRNQIKILEQFAKDRLELAKLQNRQTELFVDSIESRAEREQELATLYFCCLSGETGKPLWPDIHEMKRANPKYIEWLLNQYSYFVNGITPELEEMLQKYGFLQRLSDTNSGSDDSPVQPELSLVGEVTANEPIDSSPVTDTDPSVMTSSPESSSIG